MYAIINIGPCAVASLQSQLIENNGATEYSKPVQQTCSLPVRLHIAAREFNGQEPRSRVLGAEQAIKLCTLYSRSFAKYRGLKAWNRLQAVIISRRYGVDGDDKSIDLDMYNADADADAE